MKFTIEGFSQSKLVELGLDATDAVILRYLVDFHGTGQMIEEVLGLDAQVYFWVKYDAVLQELPIVGITNKVAFARRLGKLVEAGLMEHYTKRVGGTYSFYRFVPEAMGELIYSITKKLDPSSPEDSTPSSSPARPNNSSTKEDSSTRDSKSSIVPFSEETEKEEKNEKYVPIARLLYESHKKLDDKFLNGRSKSDLEKTFAKWAGDIRLLIEKDGRGEEIVRMIILWTQTRGCFWNGNILSGYKLRKQFPTLVMQMQRDSPASTRESKYYERNKDALRRIINGGE